MIDKRPEEDSLTNFRNKTELFLDRLHESGQPVVLTIDGEPAVIVQDAEAYRRWVEIVDRAEAIVAIRQGLDSMKRGEGKPAEEVFEELRRKYEIPD